MVAALDKGVASVFVVWLKFIARHIVSAGRIVLAAVVFAPSLAAAEPDVDPFQLHHAALAAEVRGDILVAVEEFDRACSLGLAPSCTMAGLVKLDRNSDVDALMEAARDLSAGCLSGSDFSCVKLGEVLETVSAQSQGGEGFSALAMLQMGEECRAAPTGGACHDAAALLRAEERGGADMDALQTYAAKACTRAARPGCLSVAAPIVEGENTADQASRHCLTARSDGCSALLERLLLNEELPETLAARTALEQACDKRVGIACANLGLYYSNGPDAVRDDSVARQFMRAGCDGAIAQACFAFAVMHKKGIGGTANQQRSVELVSHACALGWAKACETLAVIIQDSGTSAMPGWDAAALRTRACRLGHDSSCGARDEPEA